MFNKANGFTGDDSEMQQVNWEGWTPPWMQGEGHDPRGGWGSHGPSGHGHEHHHHHGHGKGGPRGPFGRGFGFFGFGPGMGWGILDRTQKELSDMIYNASQNQPAAGNTSEGASPDVEQA